MRWINENNIMIKIYHNIRVGDILLLFLQSIGKLRGGWVNPGRGDRSLF